jgi:hypothetical protein
MFIYRAAAFWQRAYAPEISMGMVTQEELQDVIDVRSDGTYTVTTAELRSGPLKDVDQDTGEVQPNSSTPAAGGTTGAAAGPAGETSEQGEQAEDGDAAVQTFANVNDAMHKADSIETLQVAIDMISGVYDAEQQDELRGIGRDLLKKFTTPAATAKTKRAAADPGLNME